MELCKDFWGEINNFDNSCVDPNVTWEAMSFHVKTIGRNVLGESSGLVRLYRILVVEKGYMNAL